MTRFEIPVLTPVVSIDADGKVTVACDTHATTAVLTPDHYRGADVRLVRAMYLASREWLAKMGELSPLWEIAA